MSCSVKKALTQNLCKVVSINGVTIGHDEISREARNHPAPTPIAAWTAAARALAVRELLLQEARRIGVEAKPLMGGEGRSETTGEAAIRELVEREVVTPSPDEPTCRRYYEQNLKRFRSKDLYEVAHILVAADPNDRAAYAAAHAEAQALLVVLRHAPDRLAEFAKAHSACPSKGVGGNLGQISPGETTQEFDAALCIMAPGEMSVEPVASRFGHHIIQLNRRIEGRQLPFEQVRDRIAGYLADRVNRQATAQYLARLASHAKIEGIALPIATDHRVY